MSGRADLVLLDREGRRLVTLGWAPLLRRAAIIGPVVVVLVTVAQVAPERPWWPAPALVLFAVVTAELPDSGIGLATVGGAGAWWAVAATDAPLAGSLLVAVALLACHLATAHAAAGPPGRVAEPATWLRLLGTALPLVAATVAVFAVSLAADGRVVVPTVALAAALLAAAALPWLAVRR